MAYDEVGERELRRRGFCSVSGRVMAGGGDSQRAMSRDKARRMMLVGKIDGSEEMMK